MLFWILLIVVYAVLALLFFRIMKGLLRALLSAMGVISVIVLILGVWAILDARGFAEKSQTNEELFILKEGDRMLAGTKNLFMQDENAGKKLTDMEFNDYNALFREKDYERMLEKNYKVFVIDVSAFDSLVEDDFKSFEGMSKELVFRMLRSEKATDMLIEKTIAESNMTKDYEGLLRQRLREQMPQEAELRSTLFVVLLSASMQKQGPSFLAREMKEGRMEVHPSSMMFRAIGIIPLFVFEKLSNAAMKGA